MEILEEHRDLGLAIIAEIRRRIVEGTPGSLREIIAAVGQPDADPLWVWAALNAAALVVEDEDGLYLTAATAQFESRGDWDSQAMYFVADWVDDLHARRALLRASRDLIDELSDSLLAGDGVAWVRDVLMPPAYRDLVDPRLALNLHAASVALMAGLAQGRPPACVAEEIVAVHLMEMATATLELDASVGRISEEEALQARAAVSDLWGLLGDQDVLLMFDVTSVDERDNPNRAAVLQEIGAAPQGLDAWFAPFWGLPEAGHLRAVGAGAAAEVAIPT